MFTLSEHRQLPEKDFRFFRYEGWEIVVGKTARANDQLSIKLGHPMDFWFHVAGMPGSHVIAGHADHPSKCPREVRRVAAGLAAFYSKARSGGSCSVHWAQCSQVTKKKGAPAGQVILKKYESMLVKPLDPGCLECHETRMDS